MGKRRYLSCVKRKFRITSEKSWEIASVVEFESVLSYIYESLPLFHSGAPSGRSRRLPKITRPPADYTAFLSRLKPGDSKPRD
jgi:hypothetical protein